MGFDGVVKKKIKKNMLVRQLSRTATALHYVGLKISGQPSYSADVTSRD